MSTKTLVQDMVESPYPQVEGKFLVANGETFFIKGVTYGPFRPEDDGSEYHTPASVQKDFKQMADSGINTVRVYTVPPLWLLDCAQECGLYVMVGLPWEQHLTFLNSRQQQSGIVNRVENEIRTCAGHPAILCFVIGNEIPAEMVRWYGKRRIENFLHKLYKTIKTLAPNNLVTYVNYPTTEYLELPFVDFVCFNVYLEERETLAAYLARLQNLARDRPLVMAEIGLDSLRNGTDTQAEILTWQIETVYAAGCTGAFVFSWTDEWFRGGHEIEDWHFGLTDRHRRPKPALAAVSATFDSAPFSFMAQNDESWPSVSVLVCSYNGSNTIGECCQALQQLNYPNYEVIVVDDGSTDGTGEIAESYGFHVIRTPNHGLSHARNIAAEAAQGDIVAYTDDDTRPDPNWLRYLAATFQSTDFAAVGGPNIPPLGLDDVSTAIGQSPGGPIHVLITDTSAEHIPGCNMAFRREKLLELGGFDTQFRIAGDDVDLCWRILQRGWQIGFSPAAMVWHMPRNSIKAYWRQQVNYGKAEAMLEKKWPEKYNALGNPSWFGRIYATHTHHEGLFQAEQIRYGTWGTRLFQSIYQPAQRSWNALLVIPEWYLLLGILAVGFLLSLVWQPLLWMSLPLGLGLALTVFQAASGTARSLAQSNQSSASPIIRGRRFLLIMWLKLIQPIARLTGRIQEGLTLWRRRKAFGYTSPLPNTKAIWSEEWVWITDRLTTFEKLFKAEDVAVVRGGEFDRWDLEAWTGRMASVRTGLTIEEHGDGKQYLYFRAWAHPTAAGRILPILLSLLGILLWTKSLPLVLLFSVLAFLSFVRTLTDASSAMAAYRHCLTLYEGQVTASYKKMARQTDTPTLSDELPDNQGGLAQDIPEQSNSTMSVPTVATSDIQISPAVVSDVTASNLPVSISNVLDSVSNRSASNRAASSGSTNTGSTNTGSTLVN